MYLEVKQEHAKKGTRGHVTNCPTALALRSSGWENPCVDCVDITADDPDGQEFLWVPSKALARQIVRFDQGKGFRPGRYLLREIS